MAIGLYIIDRTNKKENKMIKRIMSCMMVACSIVAVTSCKSTENAYKKAYEKAIEQDAAVTAPADVTPVQTVNSKESENVESVAVREERVTVVTGSTSIKQYGIVCGSFSLKTNADALRERLVKDGYPAVVVVNEVGKTYRVICESFSTKEEAVSARSKFKAKYPDNQDFQSAWILYKK